MIISMEHIFSNCGIKLELLNETWMFGVCVRHAIQNTQSTGISNLFDQNQFERNTFHPLINYS